jgi:folate-binding protein YgfZ
MWAIFYLIKTTDALYLVTSRDCAEASLSELKKYGVFSKVDITLADEWSVGLRITAPEDALESGAAKISASEIAISISPVAQLTLSNEAFDEDFSTLFDALQINLGISQLGAATIGEFVPQMVNLQAVNGAIDFTKGCYMGQEVVARTKYLGKNKRAGFILHAQGNFGMQQGDILEYAIGENWRRAGTVLNHAQHADESFCMAVLPNDLDSQTVLRLKAQPEVTLSILPTPYSLSE